MYKRPIFQILLSRVSEKRRFIQVLAGPRQTGKTTLAHQLLETTQIPAHYASSDEPTLKDHSWIEQQWEIARMKAETNTFGKKAILILDEIQKITGWSETVKKLWDSDTASKRQLHIFILGSSPLLVKHGLSESLTGRFETIPITHWSLEEMKQAFGWDVNQYIFYGGYPGAAELIKDHERWTRYIMDSLIETTISRDILLMKRVDKPALLRRLFQLGCSYSGQILSYQKMLGQLQDAGNTTTLAHYLELLNGAGLTTGLLKYAGQTFRQRASSPKLLVLNTALMAVHSHFTLLEATQNTEFWGRMVESAIGATLANSILGKNLHLYYWAGRNHEVDFILVKGDQLVAFEVKSNFKKTNLPGITAFSKQFPVKKKILVGGDGVPIHEFLKIPPAYWVT